jgi:Flp pilus assembly protein protease CpaA
MLTAAIMFLLLVVAVWTDLRSNKIYNWNTYSGIALALIIGAINSYWTGGETMRKLLGPIQLADAAIGLFACGAILIVCYVFLNFNGGIGGGDVKLLAMLGAFFGFEKGIEVMLWTFILAAAIGIIMLLWSVDLSILTRRFVNRLRSIFLLQTPEYPDGEGPMTPLPKCLPIGAIAASILVHFDLLTQLGLF